MKQGINSKTHLVELHLGLVALELHISEYVGISTG